MSRRVSALGLAGFLICLASTSCSPGQWMVIEEEATCDSETRTYDIHSMMVDPQGEFLALAGPLGISVADLSSGHQVMGFRNESPGRGQGSYSHILWSPDGDHLAVSRPVEIGAVFVFARDDWEPQATFVSGSMMPGPAGIAWSPEGERLGVALGDRFLTWDRRTHHVDMVRGRHDYPYGLTWPSGGPLLVLGGELDETRGLYNVETGSLYSPLSHWADGAYAYSVWAPDGRHVWLFFDLGGGILDVERNAVEGFDAGGAYPKVAWSRDGRYFSASPHGTNRIRVWDTLTEGIVREDEQGDLIWALAWTPKGDLLAVGCTYGRKALWNTETSEILFLLSP